MSVLALIRDIKDDLPKGRSGLFSFFQNYLYNAGFRVLLNHRLGKYFFNSGNFLLRQIALRYRYKMISKRGCDISYKAVLGKGLRLPHPIGIVIGEGVVIKDEVMIFQQVTFGSHGKKGEELEYPTIENNVKVYAGAKIIGSVTVGEGGVIGANALINKNVPPYSVAYGIPCVIKELRK
jgi:serine O-acetyltransferase